mgnify:CR=1 FL=1
MSRNLFIGLGLGTLLLGATAGALQESNSTAIVSAPATAVVQTAKNIDVNIAPPLSDLVNDASQRNDTHAYDRFDIDLGCGRTPVADQRNRKEFRQAVYNGSESISGCYSNPAKTFGAGLGLGLIVLGGLAAYRRR